jgi:SAM-dependent methyltransferase
LYQKKHSFVFEYGASLVDIARPNAGETILDIGCGTGELTNQLLHVAVTQSLPPTADPGEESGMTDQDKVETEVIGVDADQNMIRRAQELHPSVKFLTVDIRSFLDEKEQTMMEELNVPKTFDLIFSNAALHWIPAEDMDNVIRTISQLMKPNGGRLVVEFGGIGNVQTVVTACQDVLREQYGIEDLVTPWYFPSIAEFTTILERHGIEVMSAELYDRPTKLNDPVNGMIDWLRMFGQQFIEAAITAYDMKGSTAATASSETDSSIANRYDKELLFLTAVSERVRSKLYDGTQWIADYRRIRVVGYRR